MLKFSLALIVCLGISIQVYGSGCGAGCLGQACGNGKCEWPQEDCEKCPSDCGLCPSCDNICGNLLCEPGEGACNCTSDCGFCCEDNHCNVEGGETPDNCPSDCGIFIRGSVIDALTMQPLASRPGAPLSVVCNSRSGSVVAPVDATGKFIFGPVSSGQVSCTASQLNYETNSQAIDMDDGTYKDREFIIPLMPSESVLFGQVRVGGGLLAGAKVLCSPNGFTIKEFTIRKFSSVKGSFMIEVEPGTWTCTVSHAGWVEKTLSTVVGQGETVRLDFLLDPEPLNLKGRVFNKETGLQITDPLDVECTSADPFINVLPQQNTGVTGAFLYSDVKEGRYQCSAYGDGYLESCADCYVGYNEKGQRYCDVYLYHRPGHINGTVCDNRGNLVTRVTVTCVLQSTPDTPGNYNFSSSTISGAETYERQSINRNQAGKFGIANIPQGSYLCQASDPNRFKDSPYGTAIVVPGEYTEIKLVVIPLPGKLRGVVTEPPQFGGPVTGASVECTDVEGTVRSALTTSFSNRFNFAFDDLPPGPISCRCSAPGHLGGETDVVILESNGVQEVTCITPPILGQLRIDLYDSQTQIPVAEGAVVVTGISGDGLGYGSRAPLGGTSPGPFIFGDLLRTLRLADYFAAGSAPGYYPADGDVSVISGPEFTPFVLNLDPIPARLSGRVFDSLDNTLVIVGARVSCTFSFTPPLLGEITLETTTDATGAYKFEDLVYFNVYSCDVSADGYEAIVDEPGVAALKRAGKLIQDFEVDPILATIRATIVDALLPSLQLRGTVCCEVNPVTDYRVCITHGAPDVHEFLRLRQRIYTCTATTPTGYEPSDPIIVNANTNTPFDIVFPLIPLPSTLTGEVYDVSEETFKIQGAVVSCTYTAANSTPGQVRPDETTDAVGEYGPVQGIFDRHVECCATATGFQTSCEEADLPPDSDVILDIPLLGNPAFLNGIVYDGEFGTAVTLGQVQISLSINGRSWPGGSTTSLADGSYSFEVARGLFCISALSRDGYQITGSPVVSAAGFECSPNDCTVDGTFPDSCWTMTTGLTQEVNLVMFPIPGDIRVNVKNADTLEDLSGVSVTCLSVTGSVSNLNKTQSTDSFGNTTFLDVRGGDSFQCTATKVNFDSVTSDVFVVPRNTLVEVLLELDPRKITITAFVTVSGGVIRKEGASYEVRKKSDGNYIPGLTGPLITDIDGKVEFQIAVPTVDLVITAYCVPPCEGNWKTATTEVAGADENVILDPINSCCAEPPAFNAFTVILTPFTGVFGWVTFTNTSFASDIPIQVSGAPLRTGTGEDVGYYISEIIPGVDYVTLVPSGPSWDEKSFTSPALIEGQVVETNITLRINTIGNLSLTVTLDDSGVVTPLADAFVSLYICATDCTIDASPLPYIEALTNVDGAILFVDLPAGKYKILAEKIGFEDVETSTVVNTGSVTTRTLTTTEKQITFRVYPRICNVEEARCINDTAAIVSQSQFATPSAMTAYFTYIFGNSSQVVSGIAAAGSIEIHAPTGGDVGFVGYVEFKAKEAPEFYVWCASSVPGYQPYINVVQWQTDPGRDDPAYRAYWINPQGPTVPLTGLVKGDIVDLTCTISNCGSAQNPCPISQT